MTALGAALTVRLTGIFIVVEKRGQRQTCKIVSLHIIVDRKVEKRASLRVFSEILRPLSSFRGCP